MLLKVDGEQPSWMSESPIPSNSRFRVYAESQPGSRPSSAHSLPVSSSGFDERLEQPPHSVPIFRPISAAPSRIVYVNSGARPRVVRQNSQTAATRPPMTAPSAPMRYTIVPSGQRTREFDPVGVQRAPGLRPVFRIHSTHPQVVRSHPPPVQRQPVYVTANSQQAASPEVTTEEEVQKCIRFFRTLTNLTNKDEKYPVGTSKQLKQLVKRVINRELPPHEFAKQLQDLLQSSAQPKLVPFLCKNLPALRQGLKTGRYTIDLDDQPLVEPSGVGSQGPSQPTPQVVYTTAPQQTTRMEPPTVSRQIKTESPPVVKSDPQQVVLLPSSGLTTSGSDGVPTSAQSAVYLDYAAPTTPEPVNSSLELTMPDQLPFTMLNPRALWNRLAEQVPGCERIEPEVISRISELVESKLRDLLGELSDVAGHRLEPMRANPFYHPINDPRRQLRFVEDLAKQEQERRSELEKEALLKFSKTKSKDKDSMEKAKEIKRANQEENMNREANEAAIAALGGSRGTKRPWSTFDPMKNAASSGLGVQTHRPRIRRVNIRDLQCVLNCRDFPDSSDLKFQLAHGLLQAPGPKANIGDS